MELYGVVIEKVDPGQASNGNQKWDVFAGGKKITAWKYEVGAKAQQLIGQAADLQVQEKPATKPGFPPFLNLIAVRPAQNGAAAPQQKPVATGPLVDHEAKKNERIGKMNATSTAFAFAGAMFGVEADVNVAEEYAFELADRIYQHTNGIKPAEAEIVQQLKEQLDAEVVSEPENVPAW